VHSFYLSSLLWLSRYADGPFKHCIFCPNKPDSKEHAWADWVLKRFRRPAGKIFGNIGEDAVYDPNQKAIKVRCVCRACNGGWMKRLGGPTSAS
jgi:hypothetical protein